MFVKFVETSSPTRILLFIIKAKLQGHTALNVQTALLVVQSDLPNMRRHYR